MKTRLIDCAARGMRGTRVAKRSPVDPGVDDVICTLRNTSSWPCYITGPVDLIHGLGGFPEPPTPDVVRYMEFILKHPLPKQNPTLNIPAGSALA